MDQRKKETRLHKRENGKSYIRALPETQWREEGTWELDTWLKWDGLAYLSKKMDTLEAHTKKLSEKVNEE